MSAYSDYIDLLEEQMEEPIDVKAEEVKTEQKIIRVFFTSFEQQFCIDRPADPSKTDQENCDNALSVLVESMKSGTIVPALIVDEKTQKGQPVFMNLGMLPFIEVKNVGTYTVPQKKE